MYNVGKFYTIEAAIDALNESTQLNELPVVVSKSQEVLGMSQYSKCAEFYLAADARFKLILDAQGVGAYAEKCKKLLSDKEK